MLFSTMKLRRSWDKNGGGTGCWVLNWRYNVSKCLRYGDFNLVRDVRTGGGRETYVYIYSVSFI